MNKYCEKMTFIKWKGSRSRFIARGQGENHLSQAKYHGDGMNLIEGELLGSLTRVLFE